MITEGPSTFPCRPGGPRCCQTETSPASPEFGRWKLAQEIIIVDEGLCKLSRSVSVRTADTYLKIENPVTI